MPTISGSGSIPSNIVEGPFREVHTGLPLPHPRAARPTWTGGLRTPGHTLPFEPQQGKCWEVARVVNCPRGTHATPYKDLLRPLLSPTPGPSLGDRSLTFMPATSMRVRTWNWAPTWRTRGTQYRSMLLNWEDMGVAWAAAQGPSCDPAATPHPPFWLQSRLVMWDEGENMAV